MTSRRFPVRSVEDSGTLFRDAVTNSTEFAARAATCLNTVIGNLLRIAHMWQ